MKSAPGRLRVVGLPAEGHAYQDCFYAALRSLGVEVVNGYFAGRWLLDNVHRGDVLHLHWPSFFYAAPATSRTALNVAKYLGFLATLRLRGARIVWTAHNLYPHQSTRLRGADSLVRLATTRLAERVFAHGAHAVDAVTAEFGLAPGKVVSLPHGHWLAYFGPPIERHSARQQLGIAASARVLLLFGGLEPYKNVPLLLRAFERARSPSEVLWIVGRCKHADLRAELQDAAARNEAIRIVDRYVTDAEIPTYMHAADAVVLPYRDGLTSGAAMLALSHGVPVIAPRVGCFSTLVDADSGLLYDTETGSSSDSLVRALQAARDRQFDADLIRARASRFRWEDAASIFMRSLVPSLPP